MTRRLAATLLLVLALGAVACGGGGSDEKGASSDGSGEESTSVETDPDATTTLPPGATAGTDDWDGDGEPDPICGTQDFGAGLVLRVPCSIGAPNEPPSGTTLVKDSLYRLPGSTDINLDGISGSIVLGRDAGGAKVAIVVFNSDALFATGSTTIGSTESMDGAIRVINEHFPNGRIQVRGHTDATGSAASNQALSAQRANVVKDYLGSHAVKAREITAVGLGSSRPLTEEKNSDGSDNPDGRLFNRRVEIVVRTT